MKTQLETMFDLFVGSNEYRPEFHNPFKQGSNVIATDSHNLIMVDEKDCDFEITNKHDIRKLLIIDYKCDIEHNIKIVIDDVILNSLNDKPELHSIECGDCDGCGVVDYEYLSNKTYERYTEELDCPVCGGEGYVENIKNIYYNIKDTDYHISQSNLKLLLDVNKNINKEESIIFIGIKNLRWLIFKIGVTHVFIERVYISDTKKNNIKELK